MAVTPGNWGHLQSITKTTPSKLYLSHVKKDESYKICLATYMSQKYPGIESEIKAAINIWGYYIGREIKVEITKIDLPEATPGDSEEDVMGRYYSMCPGNIHLVMGESHFTDAAVGKTLTSYTFMPKNGKQEVRSFKRALFLKAPVVKDEYSNEEETFVVWKSLAQAMKKELSEKDILEIMKKRDQTIYQIGENELLTFKTIVHEFGHVWGMCDQYAIDGYSTNCDAKFATLDNENHIMLHDEAVMSKSSWIAKMFLSDDDIEGVRRLVERPEFTHNWPLSKVFREITVPKIANVKDIPVAQLQSAKLDSNKVKLHMTLTTNVSPVTLTARVHDKNTDSWIDFGDVTFNEPISYKSYTLQLDVGRYYKIDKAEVVLKGIDNKILMEAPVGRQE